MAKLSVKKDCEPFGLQSFFLFQYVACVEHHGRIQEQHIRAVCEFHKIAEHGACKITNVNECDFGIVGNKIRGNAASEGIAEQEKLAVGCCIFIFNRHERQRTRQKELIRVFALCLFEVVNRNLLAMLVVIHGYIFKQCLVYRRA